MTFQPDPQLVQALARDAIRKALAAGRDSAVNSAVFGHRWPEVIDGSYVTYRDLIAAEYDAQAEKLTRPEAEKTCGSRLHSDFAGDLNITCQQPEGHFWHRNKERTWTP